MTYLELRGDDNILNDVRKYSRIAIVGCPQCANYNFAIMKGLPCYKITTGGIKAVATKNRIECLTKLLQAEGKEVKSWLPTFPHGICSLHGKKAGSSLMHAPTQKQSYPSPAREGKKI